MLTHQALIETHFKKFHIESSKKGMVSDQFQEAMDVAVDTNYTSKPTR